MQNRVALGSPSLQRADHAASSVASTVSVPPGHPGDSGLWWIPFESYPTKLSHTEPLIRWLWAGPAMLERAVLIMLLFVLLDLSSACADSTASPTTTIWGSKHPMSQGLFWWLVSQQAADLGSWNGPPQRPGKKKTRWSYGSCRAVMLRGSFADLPLGTFFLQSKWQHSLEILEVDLDPGISNHCFD